jgi:hypothetical protein
VLNRRSPRASRAGMPALNPPYFCVGPGHVRVFSHYPRVSPNCLSLGNRAFMDSEVKHRERLHPSPAEKGKRRGKQRDRTIATRNEQDAEVTLPGPVWREVEIVKPRSPIPTHCLAFVSTVGRRLERAGARPRRNLGRGCRPSDVRARQVLARIVRAARSGRRSPAARRGNSQMVFNIWQNL